MKEYLVTEGEITYTVVEDLDGNKYWYLNGILHREWGPAVECLNGYKEWHLNGEYHRIGGPAIELKGGDNFWYKNGQLHRADGPAVEWAGGEKSWWLDGQELTKEEYFNRLSEKDKKKVIFGEIELL